MNRIVFLQPYLEPKVWGGAHLKNYNYQLPNEPIGEAWLVSAIKDKCATIVAPNQKTTTLAEFYSQNPAFFNHYAGQYPILTKIIDACDDLSIQVHPNDHYACKHHQQLGKTECWYILDAQPHAKIVYGLKTTSPEQFKQAVENNQIETFLNEIPVKKGDLFYVPAGLVHAIKAGVVIYELQQASDITYRLYDYNRLDHGQLRPLHVEHALNVIDYHPQQLTVTPGLLIDSPYFKLKQVTINNELVKLHIPDAMWLEVTVIEGQGQIDHYPIQKGDVFLLSHQYTGNLTGNCTLLIGYITKPMN